MSSRGTPKKRQSSTCSAVMVTLVSSSPDHQPSGSWLSRSHFVARSNAAAVSVMFPLNGGARVPDRADDRFAFDRPTAFDTLPRAQREAEHRFLHLKRGLLGDHCAPPIPSCPANRYRST